MKHPVNGQGPGLAKTLSAVIAFERFLFRMDVPVIPEMILTPERLATDITGVGSFVGVCSFVNEQIVRFGEAPLAELADELLLGPAGGSVPQQPSPFGIRGYQTVSSHQGESVAGDDGHRASVAG